MICKTYRGALPVKLRNKSMMKAGKAWYQIEYIVNANLLLTRKKSQAAILLTV